MVGVEDLHATYNCAGSQDYSITPSCSRTAWQRDASQMRDVHADSVKGIVMLNEVPLPL